MLPKEQLDRINELSRKQRAGGLTEAEREEQATLRQAYLQAFRVAFRAQLEARGAAGADSDKGCTCGDPNCHHHHHHHGLPH